MNETVEMMLNESVPDDAAQAQAETPSLAEALEDVSEPAQEAEQDPASSTKEPGWIKQRISKAVEKAKAEVRAEIRAEYEAMFAPMREQMYDQQAQELVQSGEFKSLERAKEYIRLKNGQPTQQKQETPKEQPRDDQGRFQNQGKNSDSENRVRASLLAQQAQKIQQRRGLDVMGALNDNPEIRHRVLSGEWDFYDVADYLESGEQQGRRRPPAPVRTPNGAGASAGLSIANMSDEQFERLQRKLATGGRYDVTR